jgi:hypothetical protein
MPNAILTPVLTGGNGKPTYNLGIAETYSWIPIENDQNRPMFARANYITNLSDLSISLSAGDLNIGSVEIIDHDTGYKAAVTQAGAVHVLPPDLESTIDDITIGDRDGSKASVNAATSALRVLVVNSVSAVSLTNQITSVSVTNFPTQLTAVSITNFPIQLTAVSVTNQLTGITVLNSITAVSITNPVTAVTINNPVSSVNIASTSNTLPISGTVTITNSLSTTPVGTQLVTFADGPQLDGNHRLRVALPSQTWWYVSSVDKDGDLRYNETFTTGASSIFVQNIACVTMTSGPSLTGSVIRATRRRFKIRPGVSHQWTGTVNFDGQDTGCVKRVGTFTNFNGMFFELSGTDFNVVIRRRLTDGTLAEERVNRVNFNNDKLDGNGLSLQNWSTVLSGALTAGTNRWAVNIPGDGIVYNTEFTYTNGSLSAIKPGAKATISGVTPSGYNGCIGVAAVNTATNKLTATYVFDPGVYSSVSNAKLVNTPYHNAHTLFFEFNGGRTAQVHFGINGSNGPTYLHTFDFANQLGLQYESAPALMVRNEVFNYSAMAYNPSMTIDGAAYTVEAESELNPGFIASYNTTPITLAAGKVQPILGLGLRAGEPYQRGDIQIQEMNIIDTSNLSNQNNTTLSVIHWKLLLNPGLSGVPAPVNIGKASREWLYTSTTAVTSQGIELMSGFATSQAPIDTKTSLNFLNLGSNIEYTDADKVVLTARVVTAGSDSSTIVGSMNAIEAL